jgi:Flp pilus assembly protein TadG
MAAIMRTNNRSLRGQSLVEFALLLPLLILILVGILDLGRITATYVILENAAREGARYGASGTYTQSQILARAQAEAQGTIVNPAQMTIQCTPSSCNDVVGNPLTVQITYPFTFITTYLFAGLNTLNISTNATFQIMSN